MGYRSLIVSKFEVGKVFTYIYFPRLFNIHTISFLALVSEYLLISVSGKIVDSDIDEATKLSIVSS